VAPIEYPAWVRCFLPDDWRDVAEDAKWPIETADWHARRRWAVARNEWLSGNPAAGRQASAEFAAAMSAPLTNNERNER